VPSTIALQPRRSQPEHAVRANQEFARFKPTLIWTATCWLLNAANGWRATLEETGISGKALSTNTPHGRAVQGGVAGAQSFRWSQDVIGNGDVTVVLHAAPVAASDNKYALFQSGSVGSVWLGANTDENGGNVSGQLTLGLLQTGINRSSIKVAGAVDGTLSGFVIRKQGTTGAAWKNGQRQSVTTTGTLTGSPTTAADSTQIIGSISNGSLSFEDPLLAIYVFQSALPDDLCAELSVIPNGWQLFEPEPIQIYWPSAAGAADSADASSTAGATAIAAGASIASAAANSAGSATATTAGASIASAAANSAGSATATTAGAAVASGNLNAAGAATGTLEGSEVAVGVESGAASSEGTATATAASASIASAAASAAGAATATAEGASTAEGAFSSAGAATAIAVGSDTDAVVTPTRYDGWLPREVIRLQRKRREEEALIALVMAMDEDMRRAA
jgi:hypothetical protein